MKPPFVLAGARFGRLTVLHQEGFDKYRHPLWLCRCDCGTEKNIGVQPLRSGDTVSCGCQQREAAAATSVRVRTTHGRSPRAVYTKWRSMLARCYNRKHKSFNSYGGRGITVCDEWRTEFTGFRNWALANGYAPGLTLERANNSLSYDPSNCKWATYREQAQNRRSSVYLTINGITLAISEHARRNDMLPETLASRWSRGVRGEQLFARGRVYSLDSVPDLVPFVAEHYGVSPEMATRWLVAAKLELQQVAA